MVRIKASAPGKVILFGEHAVTYNKLGIAGSLDKICIVTISKGNKNILVNSKNLKLKKSMSKKELFMFLKKINSLKEKKDFNKLKKIAEEDELTVVFIVIANIMKKYGFQPININIQSEVPKNLGSSSSVCAAVALSISKFLKKNLTKKEISNFAYEGDVIAHAGTPSGIDNSIVTYGGYICYKKSKGIKKLNINFELPLIFVDSGETAKTLKTISYIRNQRKYNTNFVDKIMDRLDGISKKSLIALKNKNLQKIGQLMIEYYTELKKLNISTKKLDRIIDIALKSEALGAKPTGGWGGGCCIVLAKNQNHANNLIKKYKKNGFKSFKNKMGGEGVKIIP